MSEQSLRSALEAVDTEIARRGGEIAAGARRLRYHLMPPIGWMGDPVGLVQFRGEYHLFFIFQPSHPEPALGHWGHFVSDDLVHWRVLPTALAPSEEYDRYRCMSGSAVVDGDGRLVLMYSGAGDGRITQNIAVSDDGVVFHKSSVNPVIAEPPEGTRSDFRDPKIFEADGVTFAVIGASGSDQGQVLLYRAGESLLEWSYVGLAAEGSLFEGTMWECPNLIALGDRYMLVTSAVDGMTGFAPVIQVGSFDAATGRFASESRRVLDGGDIYAPQVFVDDAGRRILFGWMGHRDRSDMTAEEGWFGSMTLPRELVLVAGRVRQRPVVELESLRGPAETLGPVRVGSDGVWVDTGETAEVRLILGADSARKCRVGVRVSADRSEQTCFIVDRDAGRVVCERALSGAGPATASVAEFDDHPGDLELRFFLDTTSIELFVDDGAAALTNLVYPAVTSTGFFVEPIGDGTVEVVDLTVWALNL